MEMNYCRRCGSKLTSSGSDTYTCVNGHSIFRNAVPASALWILNEKNEVLIATRAHEPGIGRFDSPGGFNDGAETFESAVSRELQEEIGLSPSDYTTPKYILSDIDTYMFGTENIKVITAVYWARLIGDPTLTPADDVAKVEFIPINDINPDDIYLDAPRTGFIALRDSGLYNT